MQKVVTIHLNGTVCSLEEQAYEALRNYLDQAQARLSTSPDRAEIITDLEQAIADKCTRYLAPPKSVVLAAEMETILAEMGPVESADEAEPANAADVKPGSIKRLYQIREGAMFVGVCNGIAAYFGIDVTLVRLAFVVLALLTFGLAIIAYIALALIIPHAGTSEERAAAYGLPFNAQELIEHFKHHQARFMARHKKEQRDWHRRKRAEQRYWRGMARGGQMYFTGTPPHFDYGARALIGGILPLLAIVSAAAFVAWALSIVSLIGTGTLFGWPLPTEIPLWADILILTVLYGVVTGPLHAFRHGVRDYVRHGDGLHAVQGVVWLTFMVLFVWFAYEHLPSARSLIDRLPEIWNGLVQRGVTV